MSSSPLGFFTPIPGKREEEHFDTDSIQKSVMLYKTVKEKTIARNSILTKSVWPSQEYADFLVENEQRINDVFAGDSSDRKSKIRKYHNIRSLSCALQEFYRLYELLTELQVPEIRQYLYSFIAYMIVSRNGINRDGRPSFDNREEEIKLLYPDYRPELLSEDIREWIEDGIWSEESIYRHIHEWIQNEERL